MICARPDCRRKACSSNPLYTSRTLYCSRKCQQHVAQKRYKRKKIEAGACPICGRPAFPFHRCADCRELHRRQQEDKARRVGRTKRRPAANRTGCRRPRIWIGRRRLTVSAKVLDALERFESIAETVWKADPASDHVRRPQEQETGRDLRRHTHDQRVGATAARKTHVRGTIGRRK